MCNLDAMIYLRICQPDKNLELADTFRFEIHNAFVIHQYTYADNLRIIGYFLSLVNETNNCIRKLH